MEYLKQYEIFIKKAKTDLKVSKLILESNDEEIDLEVILFHLQQSTEKLLKSYLSYNSIDFPKTHDIETLLKLINKNNLNLNEEFEILIDLTDYAVEGRYSILHDDIEDISEYLNLTKKLLEFILKATNE